MTAEAFLLWILAYTASLVVAGLCLWVWVLVRERRVLWLLAILGVMSLTSLVSLVLPMVLPWGRAYPVILLEVVSLYTLVVPAFISSCRGLSMWRHLPLYYIVALFVSLSAIKKHATTIYRKTGTRNARELGVFGGQ